MTTASKTKTQTMFALVDQWKASGVTRKAFCAEQAINTHTFSYWVAKRRRADQPSGGFAAVDVSGAGPSDQVTITYPNGVAIRLSSGNLPLIHTLIRLD
ncbi:IS66 family insertion sequence element accessory protein TnpA [Rhodohalobacter sp. 8-1]|uniref:IS66 family insertion sequence element accessory protein TnpA n=1 Tax=Rhodohalobacter sp. 8-1 TaxID=3131972 RepID=UPI0030EEE70B